MRRRAFLAFASGALTLLRDPSQARAPGKIGYLHPRTAAPDSPTVTVLRAAWERLGYTEPDTVLLRSAENDPRRLPRLAAELVDLGAGVLIAVGPAAVRAASELARAPVVAIDQETDPVRTGLAASFRRPGGNVTGLFLDQPSLAGKMIELLKEAAPSIERVAVVRTASTTPDQLEAAIGAARARALAAIVVEKSDGLTYDDAFSGLGAHGATGVVQLGSPGFILDAKSFGLAAEKHRLPTIAFLKIYVGDGVLMSYGPRTDIYFSRAVILADRILKGEKAGELPIEQPAQYELVINLKTARTLGLDLPPTFLARADEIIE